MNNKRDYKLDALKMFLMILVIFGHIPLLDGFLNCGLPSYYDSATLHIMTGIYAFHMPLFVIISGYFTRRKPVNEQIKKSFRLLKLFLIFHVFDLLIQSVSTQELPTLYRCIYPSFALWYLLCLFYWRVLISVIPENVNKKYILTTAFFLSLIIGFTPIKGELGLHRFFSFMPYFMIGHYWGRDILKRIGYQAITPPYITAE